MKKRAHIIVVGFVQGVGFRHFTKRKAESLGLTGWVQNLPDGRVEAVFEGEQEKVDEVLKLCHKGPFGARVDKLDITWAKVMGECKDFTIT